MPSYVNDTPCTIYKGTIVATCELIKETDIQENKDVNMSNVQHDVKKVATLPSHIENVYERGITCLDKNQQKSYIQNLKLPSLFLTNTGLEFQGLIDCSITACLTIF
jgi:hypothetical protein